MAETADTRCSLIREHVRTPRLSSMSEDDNSDRGELERLRSLVGPSEVSYDASLRDRDGAQRLAQEALAEAGVLRGQIVEGDVELSRARQDQDLLLRDRDEVQRRATEAAAEVEVLRAEVIGLDTQLTRALHDRELLLQRAAMRPGRRLFDQVRGRWRTAVAPRVKRFTGRLR
jgi:hypothetical protein